MLKKIIGFTTLVTSFSVLSQGLIFEEDAPYSKCQMHMQGSTGMFGDSLVDRDGKLIIKPLDKVSTEGNITTITKTLSFPKAYGSKEFTEKEYKTLVTKDSSGRVINIENVFDDVTKDSIKSLEKMIKKSKRNSYGYPGGIGIGIGGGFGAGFSYASGYGGYGGGYGAQNEKEMKKGIKKQERLMKKQSKSFQKSLNEVPFSMFLSSSNKFSYDENGKCHLESSVMKVLTEPKVDGKQDLVETFSRSHCLQVKKVFEKHAQKYQGCSSPISDELDEDAIKLYANKMSSQMRGGFGMGGYGIGNYYTEQLKQDYDNCSYQLEGISPLQSQKVIQSEIKVIQK